MSSLGSSSYIKILLRVLCVICTVYLFLPLAAGIVGTGDCRGPKIYNVNHHLFMYRISSFIMGRGKARVPFRERTWFYGVQGEPYSSSSFDRDPRTAE
jgi:hypothetical protein